MVTIEINMMVKTKKLDHPPLALRSAGRLLLCAHLLLNLHENSQLGPVPHLQQGEQCSLPLFEGLYKIYKTWFSVLWKLGFYYVKKSTLASSIFWTGFVLIKYQIYNQIWRKNEEVVCPCHTSLMSPFLSGNSKLWQIHHTPTTFQLSPHQPHVWSSSSPQNI